eukprot:541247-Rhodomonas_salina.1
MAVCMVPVEAAAAAAATDAVSVPDTAQHAHSEMVSAENRLPSTCINDEQQSTEQRKKRDYFHHLHQRTPPP